MRFAAACRGRDASGCGAVRYCGDGLRYALPLVRPRFDGEKVGGHCLQLKIACLVQLHRVRFVCLDDAMRLKHGGIHCGKESACDRADPNFRNQGYALPVHVPENADSNPGTCNPEPFFVRLATVCICRFRESVGTYRSILHLAEKQI